MQINNFSKLGQNFADLKFVDKSEELNQSQKSLESTIKPTVNQCDVRNMSPNELKDLIRDLRESGQISELDSLIFTMNCIDIERLGGVGSNTKMDMVNYFEQRIDAMKSFPESVGIEYEERSLNILKALEARNGANIHKSV